MVWISNIMNKFGYWGISFLIFLENVFPPIPSEVVLTFAGFSVTLEGSKITILGSIIAATIGSVLGAIVLYLIGTLITPKTLKKWLGNKYVKILGFKEQDVDKTVTFFDKWGYLAVLLGRCVPIIRSLISIPAGMFKMNIIKFIFYTTIGSLVWNTVLIKLGAYFGSNWEIVVNYVKNYSYVVLVLLIIIFSIMIILKQKKKRLGKKDK